MKINLVTAKRDFYMDSRNELVKELLAFLSENFGKMTNKEHNFILGVQEKRARTGSYGCSNKQIRWLIMIAERLDYKMSDYDWHEEMRKKYIEKYK